MWTSSRTRSGRATASCCSAWSPSAASMTSKPAAASASPASRRVPGSSSTTRTIGVLSAGMGGLLGDGGQVRAQGLDDLLVLDHEIGGEPGDLVELILATVALDGGEGRRERAGAQVAAAAAQVVGEACSLGTVAA